MKELKLVITEIDFFEEENKILTHRLNSLEQQAK